METILRANIEEFTSTDLSLMPEGLENNISKGDMADLLAYLGDVRSKSSSGVPPLDGETVVGQIDP